MFSKIAVDGDPVWCHPKMDPVRLNIDRVLPLLQEDDVGNDVGACICAESIIGKADRAEELRPLGKIFPGGRRLRVHGIPARDEGHHASRPYLVESLRKEVVMDGKAELVIGLVADPVGPERHISHREVVKVPAVRRLESRHRDLGIWIELLRDPAGNGIELDTVEPALPHLLRQHAEEISDTHRRLKDVAARKAHPPDGIVDGTDHGRARVVGVQGRSPRHLIFPLREKGSQAGILFRPSDIVRVKCLREASPAYIPRQYFLFFRQGVPVFFFEPHEELNGFDIACKFLLWTAFSEMVIGDAKVHCRHGVLC